MSALYSIVGLGEVLWDMLPTGRQLGGAPANFVCHAQALGAEARLVSRIGTDDLGAEILERMAALGVWTDCIGEDAFRPTGTVGVELDAGQPRYVIHEGVAWDFIEATPCARAAVSSADAVCFGTLAQRSKASRDAIHALIAHAAPNAVRVCDVNLRQHFYTQEILLASLNLASVLKLNDAELPVLASMFGLTGRPRDQIASLLEKFDFDLVILTRGAHGSILHDGMQWSEHSGINVPVKDTIGAGDSFTAATVLGLLSDWSLDQINEVANEIAAFVCSQAGATPPIPERLRAHFETSHA